MTAAENSRGKQKEWGLSIFLDWEFNYNMKKKPQKTSRFILPLCLKKGKPRFFKKNNRLCSGSQRMSRRCLIFIAFCVLPY